MNTTRDYTISSVKRALDILKLFDESHRELTLSDLSQLSGIGKSSMLRFTYTLLQEDFLSYNPETRKYFPFNVSCLLIWMRPLIRHALRRATFPVGEGDLPAGAFIPSPGRGWQGQRP